MRPKVPIWNFALMASCQRFLRPTRRGIRDLTGDELTELETNNATRANLYRELRKRVKGHEIVGDVLDDEKFATIVNQIGDVVGDVKELSKLFG